MLLGHWAGRATNHATGTYPDYREPVPAQYSISQKYVTAAYRQRGITSFARLIVCHELGFDPGLTVGITALSERK